MEVKKELLVPVGARRSLSPNDILMLQAEINYTHIILRDGSTVLTSTCMGIIERRLRKFNFFRPNRSTVVNLNFLEEYVGATENSVKCLVIKQGRKNIKVSVSRRRQENFFAHLNNYFQLKLT